MSKAEPMDFDRRAAIYSTSGRWTPAQLRRYVKKLRGDWGCYADGEDYVPSFDYLPAAERPKGCATPRRKDAIAARRGPRA